MKLEHEKVRNQKLYLVGYDKENDRYVLSVVITWIAWYHRYYLISKEEYEWYDTALEKLDLLADECLRAETCSERFIRSDRKEENKN